MDLKLALDYQIHRGRSRNPGAWLLVTGLQRMKATGLSAFLLSSVGSTPIMPFVRYCMISTSRQGTSQGFRRLLSVLSFTNVVLKISISPHHDLETSVLGCISREGSEETQEHQASKIPALIQEHSSSVLNTNLGTSNGYHRPVLWAWGSSIIRCSPVRKKWGSVIQG